MGADTVTVLRDLRGGATASKHFTWSPALRAWQKKSYNLGSKYSVALHRVSDVYELAALIERTRRDPATLIIRGEPRPDWKPGETVFRRYLQRKGQPPPDFMDVPREWLLADIDDYAIPEGLDLVEDTEALIERAVAELLPPEFHNVDAFWQLSSSAGFAPGILKAHVWFYLDRVVETECLKRWMLLNAKVDNRLFNAVQPHYTADPVIEGGPDPIPQRTGWIRGERDVVTLPDLDAADLGEKVRQQRQERARAQGLSGSQASTVDGALAMLGDGPGLGGFHEPLRRATWLYAAETPPWERDAEALKRRLRDAIGAAPVDFTKRTGTGEYLDNAYLGRLIFGAFEQLRGHKWETCVPEHAMPTGSVDEARERMRAAIGEFMRNPTITPLPLGLSIDPDLASMPRQGLAVVEVGLGKTEAALQESAAFIAAKRAAGEPCRVLYAIPEHRLGREIAARAEQLGIDAATFYGRDYVLPEASEAMCLDQAGAKLAQDAGVSVAKAVCGPSKDGRLCAFFFECRYQQQLARAGGADMVVLAHNNLFHQLPKELTKRVSLVVIDEAFWQAGIDQTSITLETLRRGAADHPVLRMEEAPAGQKRQVVDDRGTRILHFARGKLVKALTDGADGYARLRDSKAAKLTPAECTEAIELEWRRKKPVAMWPGMPHEERKAAAAAAAGNAQIPRIAALWSAMRTMIEEGAEATGRVELEQQESAGGSQRVILLNRRHAMTEAVLACPILLLDGTGDLEIVRHFLPGAELIAEERPAAPHVVVHQVIGPLSKTSLRKRPELLREIRDFVLAIAAGASTLVITHKEFETEFEGFEHVQVAHFGAIAGRDEWRGVRYVFLIGRPQPDPESARTMAAQLTGRPVPRSDPARGTLGVLMTDGAGVAIEVSRFDDPDLDAIRRSVTDTAIVQGAGRGRGVNRTADTPLDVWVMGNVITPWPVADIHQWKDVALGAVERMAARQLVLLSPADAHRVYPDLFVTPKAAEHALAAYKGISPHSPYEGLLIREMGGNPLVGIAYRPRGKGQQTRRAFVSSGRFPGLAAFLTDKLGSPVLVEVPRHQPRPEAPHAAPQSASPEPERSGPHDFGHPEAPAYRAPAGFTVLLCPHCGELHRHGGFGHRAAHCAEPHGRGYVLRDAGPAPASMLGGFGSGRPHPSGPGPPQ